MRNQELYNIRVSQKYYTMFQIVFSDFERISFYRMNSTNILEQGNHKSFMLIGFYDNENRVNDLINNQINLTKRNISLQAAKYLFSEWIDENL